MTTTGRFLEGDSALFDLSGKVALITGAAGLLGGVYAESLARYGADLVLTDLNLSVCSERASVLRGEYGIRAVAIHCDVTDADSWGNALDEVGKTFGGVDVLINNAGFTNTTRSSGYGKPFESFPLEDWHAILDVNLTGAFLGCREVGKGMLVRGSGSIINIASLYGIVSPHHPLYEGTGVTQPVAYSVSKAGVLGLTRYLAALWADRGVRVNAISPGGVFDGQSREFVDRFDKLNPMGRMARPDEIGGAVVFLASEASSYCTGHNLVVDGGWTIW